MVTLIVYTRLYYDGMINSIFDDIILLIITGIADFIFVYYVFII